MERPTNLKATRRESPAGGKARVWVFGGFLGAVLLGGALFALSFEERIAAAPPPVDIEQAHARAIPSASHAAILQNIAVTSQFLEEPAPATRLKRVEVARGDTLMDLLVDAGLTRREAHEAITSLGSVYDPRRLKPGQEIFLTLAASPIPEGSAEDRQLLRLALRPNLERSIEVERNAEEPGFKARAIERPLTEQLNTKRATIDSSLVEAAQLESVPPNILIEAIRTFSFDVDFQREIQPGDTFEFFYETFHDPEGRLAKTGRLLYAAMTLSGKEISYYNFTGKDGESDYYNAEGQSVRKALLRTPIDGARISSGYGKRKHPISGYTKLHKGVDFAAPRGTPIYAAGRGTVEAAGRNGGYGKYVRIRHNSTYKTAYAHMKAIAKGVKRGAKVRQGQVIGYVGSTGRSTGPHLHYEIHKNGRQVNPMSVRLPSGEKLKGEKLARFQERRAEIDAMRASARVPLIADQQN